MSYRYRYFKGDSDKDFIISSMRKYVKEKQEMDKFLENLISPVIKSKSYKILDACCGIGHILYFLNEISPTSHFLGIDQTEYLIQEAKILCSNKKNIEFKVADLYDFAEEHEKEFDVCINWKTLSWIPYYTDFMKALLKVTKHHIFLSALFYDGDIDFQVRVREYEKESGKDDFNLYYNVYSYPRFKEFISSLGAKKIQAFEFEINKDLPKPPKDQMGTYTVKLENGKRLQISGAVIMSWKIVQIDL